MRHATREEIREVDRIAIEDYAMPGVILMENAGRGAAEVAMQMLEPEDTCCSRSASAERAPGTCRRPHVAIVCGRGNNGGDGFVVARHLDNRGIGVTVHLLAPRDKIGGDALVNLQIAEKMKLDIRDARPDELDFAESGLSLTALRAHVTASGNRSFDRTMLRLYAASSMVASALRAARRYFSTWAISPLSATSRARLKFTAALSGSTSSAWSRTASASAGCLNWAWTIDALTSGGTASGRSFEAILNDANAPFRSPRFDRWLPML